MTQVIMQLLWVAAHHGLRRHAVRKTMPMARQRELWKLVHDITNSLDNPGAPGS